MQTTPISPSSVQSAARNTTNIQTQAASTSSQRNIQIGSPLAPRSDISASEQHSLAEALSQFSSLQITTENQATVGTPPARRIHQPAPDHVPSGNPISNDAAVTPAPADDPTPSTAPLHPATHNFLNQFQNSFAGLLNVQAIVPQSPQAPTQTTQSALESQLGNLGNLFSLFSNPNPLTPSVSTSSPQQTAQPPAGLFSQGYQSAFAQAFKPTPSVEEILRQCQQQNQTPTTETPSSQPNEKGQ